MILMLYPVINEVKELLKDYDLVPVFYEVLSDTCTPIHIFQALRDLSETCFILESVDNTQWGRYSFIGISPRAEIRIKNGTVTLREQGGEKTTQTADPIGFLTVSYTHLIVKFPHLSKIEEIRQLFEKFDSLRCPSGLAGE